MMVSLFASSSTYKQKRSIIHSGQDYIIVCLCYITYFDCKILTYPQKYTLFINFSVALCPVLSLGQKRRSVKGHAGKPVSLTVVTTAPLVLSCFSKLHFVICPSPPFFFFVSPYLMYSIVSESKGKGLGLIVFHR